MSNINKAILKIAQSNPEFRAALKAELSKEAGDLETIRPSGSRSKKGKLMKRHEKILKDKAGNAMSFDELPSSVQSALRKVKDSESLWSDVDRWLGDNNNPHLRSANQKQAGWAENWSKMRFALHELLSGAHKLTRLSLDPDDLYKTIPDVGQWEAMMADAEKADAMITSAMATLREGTKIVKMKREMFIRRTNFLGNVLKAMVAQAPDGVKAKSKFTGAPDSLYMAWATPGDRNTLSLEFDYNDYTGTSYKKLSVFPTTSTSKYFDIKPSNPQATAKAIWDQMQYRGLLDWIKPGPKGREILDSFGRDRPRS